MPPNGDLSDSDVGETTSSCGETPTDPAVYDARWHHREVSCGDRTVMIARTRDVPIDTAATLTIKKVSDSSVVETKNVQTYSTYFGAVWDSKKPDARWNGPDVKFTATAAGLSDDSADPQLTFHRYPDVPGEYSRADISSVGAVHRYAWERLVYVSVSDRVLNIQVPLKVTVHTVNAPERGKLQTNGSYERECNRQALRGDGNLTDAEKTQWGNWIHNTYQRKVVLHRERCVRHSRAGGCDCDPAFKCCKMEVRVWALFYDRNDRRPASVVHYWNGGGRANSGNWYSGYVTNGMAQEVWSHEVGHLMGFYDEYNPDGAWGPNPPWRHPHAGYLMGRVGAGPPLIAAYYFDFYAQWLSTKTGEVWRAIPY